MSAKPVRSPKLPALWVAAVLTALATSAVGTAAIGEVSWKTPVAPDIILVVVDSLRADHLGCQGYGRNTTPFLDDFAKEAAHFRNAFSMSSWTLPSITGIFTSTTPDVHKNQTGGSAYSTNVTTIAEALRDAGYQTVGITCNHMTSRKYGFHRGFDVYDDSSITALLVPPGERASPSLAATGATTTRMANSWLVSLRDKSKPLFLFLLYMDPHWDYVPPPPYDGLFTSDPRPLPRAVWALGKAGAPENVRTRTVAAYDGEIRYTDHCISNLVASIMSSPRSDNTLIAVCADHGEAFWERGLASHGNNLHDEEIHVPLIIRPPPALLKMPEGGRVVESQVGLIDIAKTLLDFAGAEYPHLWEKGNSLRPLIAGELRSAEIPVVLDLRIGKTGARRGVRTPEFKLISDLSGDLLEIYSLRDDPGETNNLVHTLLPIPDGVSALLPLLVPCVEDVK
jgi:arylsulfatase A-like enzyme